jgi:cell pole-organizing protein PopZ
MAEAKNKGKADAEQDQSMEEILQSIRRIIAEEGDDQPRQSEESDNVADINNGSNILELTDVIKDDGSVININSPEPSIPPVSKDLLADIDHVLTNPTAQSAGEGLLSKENAFAAAAALRPVMEVNSRSNNQIPFTRSESAAFRSGATVEDLTIEALTPMLKTWLDANLKGMVERLVEKEIKRIVALNSD